MDNLNEYLARTKYRESLEASHDQRLVAALRQRRRADRLERRAGRLARRAAAWREAGVATG